MHIFGGWRLVVTYKNKTECLKAKTKGHVCHYRRVRFRRNMYVLSPAAEVNQIVLRFELFTGSECSPKARTSVI